MESENKESDGTASIPTHTLFLKFDFASSFQFCLLMVANAVEGCLSQVREIVILNTNVLLT